MGLRFFFLGLVAWRPLMLVGVLLMASVAVGEFLFPSIFYLLIAIVAGAPPLVFGILILKKKQA